MGACSHCGILGHNYVRCPELSREQINAMKQKKKEEKLAAEQRRQARRERQQQQQQQQQQQRQTGILLFQEPNVEHVPVEVRSQYEVINATDHEIVCYSADNDKDQLKRFLYIGSHTSSTFTCFKNKHKISIIPSIEVLNEVHHGDGAPHAKETINIPHEYTTFFDMEMKDFDGSTIVIDTKYDPPKKEIDEWKETALKSYYILKQIEELTSVKKNDEIIIHERYEPISAFIDVIQDIKIPNSCTEVDKERAGIPSALTNIT